MRMSSRTTLARAKSLRRQMSPVETCLWSVLRGGAAGPRFRRQHAAGPYVLDFYCAAAALAIEVDGAAHDMGDNPARDEARDAWIAAHGIKTLRFNARDIFDNLEGVVVAIQEECASRSPSTGLRPVPLPRKSGGG
jgi:very-short-patch-repair endonuclease